jgi:hypothetical protein
VWLKLEEQNPEFFKAYHIRLRIKEQITAFNYLVSQQAQLMQKAGTGLPGANQQAVQLGMQPALSPLVGQPMAYGIPPYAPLPQLSSLQALATQAVSSVTSTHPTPIAPKVSTPPTTRRDPASPQTNGLPPSVSPFVSSMASSTDGLAYRYPPTTPAAVTDRFFSFGSPGASSSFSINEELKDDTPITEDIGKADMHPRTT